MAKITHMKKVIEDQHVFEIANKFTQEVNDEI